MLNKIKGIPKKYWILAVASLMATVYIVSIFMKSPPVSIKNSPPISTSIATYNNIVPGTSTQQDVSKNLGKPSDTKVVDGLTVSSYTSSNIYRFNKISFSNDVVSIIKEVVNSNDNKDSTFVTKQYGDAPYILYNDNPNNAFNLYVYPQNGIAYLGHVDGTLLEIWYFSKTNIDDFIKNWGNGFSKNRNTDISY